ncbi:MAG: 16S rRNA (uracil(1498)-N(3))-methyltransferase [Clostridia bacterium]|nr:16S rRNA (uracil(1498)-N(3))-methyltransferase [Clostridia bacterium]
MPRFFVNSTDISDHTINITGEDVSHIKKVLRLTPGDNIIVSDGVCQDYLVEIERFEQDHIRTKVIRSEPNTTEPPIDITLFQGLPKSDKMDFIIQKSIELGVTTIFPVITERTIVRIDQKKDAAHKVTRWQRIAIEAAKQSNRGKIPKIEFPINFDNALNISKGMELSLIPYEKESKSKLKDIIQGKRIEKIAVFIGPEGGFTENEIERSLLNGIKPVTLGPRILRTETAGLAVLSILMYELGDVGG